MSEQHVNAKEILYTSRIGLWRVEVCDNEAGMNGYAARPIEIEKLMNIIAETIN